MAEYTAQFYEGIADDGVSTASAVVPAVLDLVGPVSSVLDLGCGVGAWLSVFADLGVDEVCGVDGDYVPRDHLLIDRSDFVPFDLSKPFPVERSYDLSISTEVAEHLPESAADGFVDALTTAAPCVLFSAAIPGQGGTGHVNEQWPDYWAEKFTARGYTVIDAIRPLVWSRRDVSSCIAQNMLLYVRNEVVAASPALRAAAADTRSDQLSIVHPRRYDLVADASLLPVRRALSALPKSVVGAVRRRVGQGSPDRVH